VATSFNTNSDLSSIFLKSTGSDRSSFEIDTANLIGHDSYAPKPREVYLIGKLEPGWKITKPLLLTIDEDPNGIYISDSEFHVYGYGKTKSEALEDYDKSLIEYYQILTGKDDVPTQALLSRLQSFLLPTT
jgi:hypothetical protein